MRHARLSLVAVTAAGALALTACSSSSDDATDAVAASSAPAPAAPSQAASTADTSAAPATGALDTDLAGVCPSTVVVQQDWEPEAEHSGVYALVGPGYTVDTNKKRVTGPLVIGGKDTGVKIQVRAGGSAIGFQSIIAQMYIDKSITLGAISTDGALGISNNQAVTAVVAQLNKSPQMLMWDPASHPDWTGIADMGKSDAKVVVAKGAAYATLLVKKGLLTSKQIDQGYTGAPARFISQPKIAQQGFATAEPYIYENEVAQWKKPVKFQLISDVGYNGYPEALSVRTADVKNLAPCLKKLVPILQQVQIDYLMSPDSTNTLIDTLVKKYNDGWSYSLGVAQYAAKAMKDLGIVQNDTSGPLGGMDMGRVQSFIDEVGPILAADGVPVPKGLKASDIATTEFIDPSITLK